MIIHNHETHNTLFYIYFRSKKPEGKSHSKMCTREQRVLSFYEFWEFSKSFGSSESFVSFENYFVNIRGEGLNQYF